MKYRVQIDVSFDQESDAIALLNHIEDIKQKTYNPVGVKKIPCFQIARYHACSHDDINPVQCNDYVDVDFTKKKKIHEVKGVKP